ncbi:MAG: hypothetical protein ABI813_06865 [Bacteroidota bacterium]
MIDGAAYAVSENHWARLDNVESEEVKIIVDGKWMTMEEANASVNRFELSSIDASSGKRSVELYGINANVLALHQRAAHAFEEAPSDTVPAPPSLPATAKTQLNTIPAPGPPVTTLQDVASINIREEQDKKNGAVVKTATVILKSGHTEQYHLNDPKEKAAYLKKFGAMPITLPVPVIAAVSETEAAPLKVPAAQAPPAPEIIPAPAVPAVDQAPARKPLIVVNDEIKPGEYEIKKISPNSIKSIDVLTDKTATDKYGSKGQDGVIEITTTPPLYIVDGVEQAAEFKIRRIPPQNIKSLAVSKDSNATDKYGDKGKNGVVEIHMKKDIPIPPGTLIILDGRKLPAGAKLENYIQAANIESINVLEGKAATDKYGKKAKSGAIIIQSKKLHPAADKT